MPREAFVRAVIAGLVVLAAAVERVSRARLVSDDEMDIDCFSFAHEVVRRALPA